MSASTASVPSPAIASHAPAGSSAAAPSLSQLTIERGGSAPTRRSGLRGPMVLGTVAIAVAAAAWALPRPVEVKATSVLLSSPSQQAVQLTASGYVVAQRRAAVASKATGRLVELNVREGSTVRKDELIARLDASDVQASVLAAQAAVQQAEANLQNSKVQLLNAREELRRTQDLQGEGFLSPQAMDNAQTRHRAAAAAERAAQAALAQARAQLQAQQVSRSYTEIRAPFDGVVLVKNANVGDIITPMSSAAGAQGAVVTMADMSTLEVEADVSEGSLSKTRVGQPVEITLDAWPSLRLRGSVAGIVPTIDRAKASVMTKIRFDALDPRILPEMSAKVAFLSRPVTAADQVQVLAVAPDAVAERDGRPVVFRIVGGAAGTTTDGSATPSAAAAPATVEAVSVTLGRSLGALREVSGALHAGDKLVSHPPARLKPGARVAVAAS